MILGFWNSQFFFVIGENLRKQVLPKNLNAAHLQKKESEIQDLRNDESKSNLKV